MRRLTSVLFVALLVGALAPAAVAHPHQTPHQKLRVSVDRAPVTPDGTTAGAITDFVLTFVDRNPAVDGISLREGATVTATLPHGFTDTGDGTSNAAILLQGWPQSPPAPLPAFPWTTTVAGNEITATLTADFLVGDTGPGAKQVHLLLNSFRNPGPGLYGIGLAIQPDPASPEVHRGTGYVHILPKARPSLNVVSVFSGPGPPPLPNPLYQSVVAGDDSLDVGMYLWDRGSDAAKGVFEPFVGVDLEMVGKRFGRMVQDGRTVGHVWIRPPSGARDFALTTDGPSILGNAAVTGFPTGILVMRLGTDADAAGLYKVSLRFNGGNTQRLYITTE